MAKISENVSNACCEKLPFERELEVPVYKLTLCSPHPSSSSWIDDFLNWGETQRIQLNELVEPKASI